MFINQKTLQLDFNLFRIISKPEPPTFICIDRQDSTGRLLLGVPENLKESIKHGLLQYAFVLANFSTRFFEIFCENDKLTCNANNFQLDFFCRQANGQIVLGEPACIHCYFSPKRVFHFFFFRKVHKMKSITTLCSQNERETKLV
jgi:hypothetical protein